MLPCALLRQGIGGAHIKKYAAVMMLLFPAILIASVTEKTIPSTSEAYLAEAHRAMEDEDFEAALLLYEEAIEREPHSQAALAGRLAALARSNGSDSSVEIRGRK